MYLNVEKELAVIEEFSGKPIKPIVREFMAYCLNEANKAYTKGFESGFLIAAKSNAEVSV